MLGHGVLLTASHNVCYAHDNENFSTALNAYDQALGFITERLASGNLANALTGPVIEPVFKVR